VGELKFRCDYSLFKKGIYPCWDDYRNMNGGRWIFSLDVKLFHFYYLVEKNVRAVSLILYIGHSGFIRRDSLARAKA
jgi:hypothetical protein